MPTPSTSSKPPSKLKERLIFFAVAAVLLVASYLIIDHPATVRFDTANKEMESIRHNEMEPLGGVEASGEAYKPTIQGNDFFNFLGDADYIDVHIPQIGRTWFVPIGAGQEYATAQSIAEKAGYQATDAGGDKPCSLKSVDDSCLWGGTKGALHVWIEVRTKGPTPPPAHNVDPKVWRVVNVSITLD